MAETREAIKGWLVGMKPNLCPARQLGTTKWSERGRTARETSGELEKDGGAEPPNLKKEEEEGKGQGFFHGR